MPVIYQDFVDFFAKNKRKVDKLVDIATGRYTSGKAEFDQDVPVVNYEDRRLLTLKTERSNTLPMLASVIAEEEEIPNETPFLPLSAEAMSNLKLGLQHVFLARQYERLNELNQLGLAPQVRQAIEESFMGSAVDLVPSMIALATRLMVDILTSGACNYRDPRTGAIVRLMYPTDNTLMLPPLAGNETWTPANAATADAIGNLQAHANAYYARWDMFPPRMYIRRSTLLNIAGQASFKRSYAFTQAGQVVGSNVDVSGVPTLNDASTINVIKMLTGIGNITMFEAKYRTRLPDGTPQENYYLEEGKYFFTTPNMAERAFVPTVERNFQPGFYVAARVINDAPRQERVAGVSNYVPFVFDSTKIAARQVA